MESRIQVKHNQYKSLWQGEDMYFKRGVTLIESLTVIAVLGILTAYSAPYAAQLIRKSAVVTAGADLRDAITLARTEAINRSVRTGVCPTVDGKQCAGASEWSHGWMVYLDESDSQPASNIKQDITILRSWINIENDLEIAALKGGGSLAQKIHFDEYGLLVKETSLDFSMRTFNIKSVDCDSGYAQTISVMHSGQLSLRKATCAPVL
ncbi:MAG: GspH/FimT family pseudopilin [Reinekea sp.]